MLQSETKVGMCGSAGRFCTKGQTVWRSPYRKTSLFSFSASMCLMCSMLEVCVWENKKKPGNRNKMILCEQAFLNLLLSLKKKILSVSQCTQFILIIVQHWNTCASLFMARWVFSGFSATIQKHTCSWSL